jgi:hypothetical protein
MDAHYDYLASLAAERGLSDDIFASGELTRIVVAHRKRLGLEKLRSGSRCVTQVS